MKFELLHPADQIVMMMQRIYGGGLTTMSGGNLSILDSDGDIWITPSGIDKGNLTRDDIMQVKPDGTIIGRHKPSVELPFHSLVYKTRPDVRAVLHAHPPALVSYSLLRQVPNTTIIPTPYIVCGKVESSAYEVPGSIKLGQNIAKVFKKGINVVMMDNHGVVVCGDTIYEAFKRFETLEYCARLNIQSNVLGECVCLNEEQLELAKNRSVVPMGEFIPADHNSAERTARRVMVEFVHRSYHQQLFTSTQGNISCRLGEDSFLITPHDLDRAYLDVEDIVRVDHGWKEAGKLPSRSVLLHKRIYEMHPEINSVIIAHPTNVMAFGVTKSEIDSRTIPESYINMRSVQSVPFGSSITDIEKTASMISNHSPVLLVVNDCVIVGGTSLINAFDRLEVTDFTAKTLIQAKQLGTPVRISDEEVEVINKVFNLK